MIRWELVTGAPVRAGDITVTPQAHALTVRLGRAGLVWNRPAAVLIERDGRVERKRILDVTRIAQLALLGLGLMFAIIALRGKRA